MIALDLAAQGVAVTACIVIIWRSEPALANMTAGTHFLVRFSMWLAVVGAVARIGWVMLGGVPDPITLVMLIGMAALIVCERRLRVLTGTRRRHDEKSRGVAL